MDLADYTLTEEIDYIQYVSDGLPFFAPGELHKIKNYEIAREQGFYGWVLHHRLGHIAGVPMGSCRKDLILNNRYYARPADELLFLLQGDHKLLHKGEPVTENYPGANNPAYLEKVKRYRALIKRLDNLESISRGDCLFVVSFCHRTGRNVPTGCTDKPFRYTGITDKRKQIAASLIKQGIGDLTTRLQQREMLIQFLYSTGEYSKANVRAIEKLLLSMDRTVLLSYSIDERRQLCSNAVAESRKAAASHRLDEVLNKMEDGQKLTSAERVFKSRHKELTCDRMRCSHRSRNNTDIRFKAVRTHMAAGKSLCAKDYAFYMYYCRTHGIATEQVHLDKSAAPVVYDKPSIQTIPPDVRYHSLIDNKKHGDILSSADYAFLCRYCNTYGLKLPKMRAVYLWDEP